MDPELCKVLSKQQKRQLEEAEELLCEVNVFQDNSQVLLKLEAELEWAQCMKWNLIRRRHECRPGNCAACEIKQQRTERILRNVAEGFEQGFGKDYPGTLTAYTELAVCLLGRVSSSWTPESILEKVFFSSTADEGCHHAQQEGEMLYRRALSGCRRVYGEHSDETLLTLGHLARLLEGLGKFKEAGNLYQEALGLCEGTHGESSEMLLTFRRQLNECSQKAETSHRKSSAFL